MKNNNNESTVERLKHVMLLDAAVFLPKPHHFQYYCKRIKSLLNKDLIPKSKLDRFNLLSEWRSPYSIKNEIISLLMEFIENEFYHQVDYKDFSVFLSQFREYRLIYLRLFYIRR